MLIYQRIARLAVVEIRRAGFPPHDVEVRTIMLGVALHARLAIGRRLHDAGMHAAFLLQSPSYLCVAIQAFESGLTQAEGVAGSTLSRPIKFGVRVG